MSWLLSRKHDERLLNFARVVCKTAWCAHVLDLFLGQVDIGLHKPLHISGVMKNTLQKFQILWPHENFCSRSTYRHPNWPQIVVFDHNTIPVCNYKEKCMWDVTYYAIYWKDLLLMLSVHYHNSPWDK